MSDRPNMDNNRLIVVSKTRKDFDLAIQLAFRHSFTSKGWWIYNHVEEHSKYEDLNPCDLLGVASDTFLVLCSWNSNKPGFTPFPVDIDWETAADFAWKWLESQPYNKEPSHDGSNSKGFVVFNESWGHVYGDHTAICAIGPAWAMHGK